MAVELGTGKLRAKDFETIARQKLILVGHPFGWVRWERASVLEVICLPLDRANVNFVDGHTSRLRWPTACLLDRPRAMPKVQLAYQLRD